VQGTIKHLHDDHDESLAEETDELSTANDTHMADMASATLDREIDYTLEENAEDILEEIEAALKRVDAGTFGTCTNCGRPIAEERLEARPWAALCIDCARKAEQLG
jgi:RNA polymerase-binding protein DksA